MTPGSGCRGGGRRRIRRATSRPRPVPLPTSFVVKNGSNTRSRMSGGIPGPSSAMSISAQSPSALVVIVMRPLSPRASIALARRLVQTWLSSAPWTVSCGSVRIVITLHLDLGVLELVSQDGERGVQSLAHVDLDHLAAVHVGVGLDRLDELAHPVGRLAQLGRQLTRSSATRRSSAASPPSPGRRLRRPGPRTPGRCRRPPAARRSAMARTPRRRPARRTAHPRRRPRRGSRAACALTRSSLPRAAARPAPRPAHARSRTRPASPTVSVSTSSVSPRSDAARLAAAAGLFSSWARPADIVPSDARRSRFCSQGGDPPHHRPHLGHHPAEHRAVREHEVDEPLRLDDRDSQVAPGHHPDRRRPSGQGRDGPHPRGGDVIADRLVAGAVRDQRLDRPLQDQHQPGLGLVLLGHHGAGGDLVHHGGIAPDPQLLVSELGEQVHRPQLGDRGMAHASARYSWIRETAIEPSPTALATRLIERARTSPATNTPGTLVSSVRGSRVQRPPVRAGHQYRRG